MKYLSLIGKSKVKTTDHVCDYQSYGKCYTFFVNLLIIRYPVVVLLMLYKYNSNHRKLV